MAVPQQVEQQRKQQQPWQQRQEPSVPAVDKDALSRNVWFQSWARTQQQQQTENKQQHQDQPKQQQHQQNPDLLQDHEGHARPDMHQGQQQVDLEQERHPETQNGQQEMVEDDGYQDQGVNRQETNQQDHGVDRQESNQQDHGVDRQDPLQQDHGVDRQESNQQEHGVDRQETNQQDHVVDRQVPHQQDHVVDRQEPHQPDHVVDRQEPHQPDHVVDRQEPLQPDHVVDRQETNQPDHEVDTQDPYDWRDQLIPLDKSNEQGKNAADNPQKKLPELPEAAATGSRQRTYFPVGGRQPNLTPGPVKKMAPQATVVSSELFAPDNPDQSATRQPPTRTSDYPLWRVQTVVSDERPPESSAFHSDSAAAADAFYVDRDWRLLAPTTNAQLSVAQGIARIKTKWLTQVH